MLRDVVAMAWDGLGTFGLGVVSEVFGTDRTDAGLPAYDFAVAAETPGPVRTDTGLTVQVEHGLERAASADLLIALSWADADVLPPPAVCQVFRDALERGARVMSHCSGAYVLAAAGLLDGRTVATHWMYADDLARRYPAVHVDPHVLYVDDDPVWSSAGTAAGIDTCLHLLRREHGAAVAGAIARRMVVPPYRDGGQAQYVETPVPAVEETSRLRAVLEWAQAHLDEPLAVDELAARALMSPRSFARHFRAATGSTPHAWLLGQRIARAQELLEQTDLASRRSPTGPASGPGSRCGTISHGGSARARRRTAGPSGARSSAPADPVDPSSQGSATSRTRPPASTSLSTTAKASAVAAPRSIAAPP